MVTCVSPGSQGVQDYELWAENKETGSGRRQYFTPPTLCTSFSATMTDLPQRTTATTYRVRARARQSDRYTGPWSAWVDAATTADSQQRGGGDPEPQAALTASFEQVPEEHDGKGRFALRVRFSEALGAGRFRAVGEVVQRARRPRAGRQAAR